MLDLEYSSLIVGNTVINESCLKDATSIVIIMVELMNRLTTTKGILEKFENNTNVIYQILKNLELKL